jgi:signal transduction histidine kinase
MPPVLSDHVGNTLVQSVSHDLRAPLASIQMAAAFLHEQRVGVETRNEMLAEIEANGGSIGVKTTPGGGATFVIRLPAAHPGARPTHRTSRRSTVSVLPLTGTQPASAGDHSGFGCRSS